jgi:RHS repeat-associated protein
LGFPHHGVKSSGVTTATNNPLDISYDHNTIDGRARVSSIISENNSVTYTHGTSDELIKKTETKNGNTYTTYYADGGKYELRIDNNNVETKLSYLGSGVVKYDAPGTTEDKMLYLLKDHLGSVIKVLSINNNSITVEESFSYDVWGNRRNPTTWENTNITTPTYIFKGFTGHENIEGFGLIHMKGRVYDPALGLFLSPDPYVQSMTAQGFNRYSYCNGNPLMYIDPDGEFVFSALLAPIGLAPLGFIMDAACWGAVIGGGTYTISAAMNSGGLSNNWNSNDFWRSVGVGAVSGAVTGGMGLIAPTFSVASTSFAANLPAYIGKAGYSMLTAAVATGAGMLTYDKLDDGEINNHFSEYVKGMGIAALTAGLTSFGRSVHDYFTWDKLSISEKVAKIQNKFGTNVHYNSDLLKDGQFETINSYVEIGPSALNKSKGYAFSVTRHELKHLKDWNKYISGDLKIPVKRTLQDHFEIRAYKLEMRYGRTTLKEYIYNLNYIKDNHGYNGFGTFTPNPFIYFNSIF